MAPITKYQESPNSQSEEAIAVPSENTVSKSEKYVCPPWSYHCRPDNPAAIDTKSELVDPSETSPRPQLGTNAAVSIEDIAMPPKNSPSGSEKFVCPPWSYHCRPDHPAPIDLKSKLAYASETTRQTDVDAVVADAIAVPLDNTATGSEKYVCPPWSYHCRPSHPAPINAESFSTTKTVDNIDPNIRIGEGTDSKPEEEDLLIPATTLIGHPSVVPSPTVVTDAEETNQVKSAGVSKREIGNICILSKDPVTGMLVDKCQLLNRGSSSDPSKSKGGNDLLADLSKYGPKRIDSNCFLDADPSSQNLTLTCPPGASLRLGPSTQNPIVATSIPKDCSSWRLSVSHSSYRDWDIVLPVIAIALLVYALAQHLLGRRKGSGDHSKQAKKHKKPKTGKQMYSVDAKGWPAGSEDVGIDTLPTKPGHCVLSQSR